MGRHSASGSAADPVERPAKQRRPRPIVLGAVSAAAVAIAVVAAIMVGGGNSGITIRGDVSPGAAFSGLATSQAGCSKATPSPGTQITVSSPAGRVIGSGTLGIWSTASATADGVTMSTCDMRFTIKNVPAETRYCFEINSVPGEVWVTNGIRPVALGTSSNGWLTQADVTRP